MHKKTRSVLLVGWMLVLVVVLAITVTSAAVAGGPLYYWANVVDVAAYEGVANPDGSIIDSNPYSLIATTDGFVVSDAGANALLEVDAVTDNISTVTVFATRTVPFMTMTIPMEAVPTGIVQEDADTYVVGQLTGFPFPVDGARVYDVPAAGGSNSIREDGFTNVLDVAFGDDGSLYVLEMFTNGILSGDPTGAVIQVMTDTTRTTVTTDLIVPTGMTYGPDGLLYISNCGACPPGAGTVVSVDPTAPMTPTVVASGLNQPRGLTFGPDGYLYIAEAGEGGQPGVDPCIGDPGEEICFAMTGGVSRVMADGTGQERIVADMASLAIYSAQGTEVVGPQDVTFDAAGDLYAIVGLGADPAVRGEGGPLGAESMNLGQLVWIAPNAPTDVTLSGVGGTTSDGTGNWLLLAGLAVLLPIGVLLIHRRRTVEIER